MKRFVDMFAGCLVVIIVTGVIKADDKKDTTDANKKKIVGIWKVKKLALELPKDALWEFEKNGKLILYGDPSPNVPSNLEELIKKTIEEQQGGVIGEQKYSIASGTYKIDGNTLTLTFKMEGDEKELTHKTTIKKLTDKEFQTEDNEGVANQFTRKK